jgi:phenylacetate-CoA ligase
MKRHESVAIYGFTSMLEFVARQVLQTGDLPPIGRVCTAWNGGEMLFETQSALFKKAFGVPILNYYGGRELSTMAYQPAAGASLNVVRPFMFLEIVDEEGKPVEPGKTGRLIWTSTICRGTPFLRYDIGDVGCYESSDSDESGIRGIKELQGRYAGLLRLPNGKTISCLFWNHFFKDFPEVEQFQVVLYEDREIHLRLKGSSFSHKRENDFRYILVNFIGEIPVKINWLPRIPLTAQGKLVQVVRERNVKVCSSE